MECLNFCDLDVEEKFVKILQAHPNLEGLFMNDSSHAERCIVDVCEALVTNCRGVRLLSLSNTSLTDQGALAVVRIASRLRSLDSLIMARNKITTSGAIAIAQALPECTTLTAVTLTNNPIGPAGVIALARSMAVSPALIWIAVAADVEEHAFLSKTSADAPARRAFFAFFAGVDEGRFGSRDGDKAIRVRVFRMLVSR